MVIIISLLPLAKLLNFYFKFKSSFIITSWLILMSHPPNVITSSFVPSCVGEPGSTLFKNIPALQVCVWISLVHNITGVLYFSRGCHTFHGSCFIRTGSILCAVFIPGRFSLYSVVDTEYNPEKKKDRETRIFPCHLHVVIAVR